MVISNSQFCTNLIPEFFKPSGPLSLKTQVNLEVNRALVSANIISNYKIKDNGKIEVEINKLNLKEGKNLFRQDCFDFNCFTEEGIFTYIPDISNICIVNIPGQAPSLMTQKERNNLGISCHLDNLGNNTFFVRGTKDINDYVYLADIGIINTTSGTISFIDKNVSFYKASKKNSLFAISNNKIPEGIKVVIIKRVSRTTIEYIGRVYGQLENEFYFPHNSIQLNREFNTRNQSINLENLSLNLLLLSNFKQYEILENQIVYKGNNYSSPLIETTITQSTNILTQLINTIDTKQLGAIPATIASYSTTQNEYNSTADNNYLNKIKECFTEDCFDTSCFEKIINNVLLDRSIDNRALSWLIQYLASFNINYNVDITFYINLLINYLTSQKDRNTKLYYKGWDLYTQEELCDNFNTEENVSFLTEDSLHDFCSELLPPINNDLNQYNKSLYINKEILSSTNISIFFALLKSFETTQDFNYLIEADELYTAIKKYLINSNGLIKHSYLESNTSIEAATYYLLFIICLEEYDTVLNLIEFFKQKLLGISLPFDEEVFVGNTNVLVDTDNVEISSFSTLGNNEFKLFRDTPYDNINTLEDIFKFNYLIYSNLLTLNNKIYIPYLEQIEEKYNVIYTNIETNREEATLIFCLSSLVENKSILEFSNSKFNSVPDLNNYRFQKDFIFNNLLLSTPKDYGWFNPNIINKTSHLGNIYYGISKTLAYNATKYEFNKKLLSIDNIYGVLLNKKAKDYNLTRLNKEEDDALRARIKSEIFTRGINKQAIEDRLTLFNSTPVIKDNVNAVLAYEDNTNYFYNYNWGVGYLQGAQTFNTNITTLNFSQPVEADVYNEIQKFKPAGIKINITEYLLFNIKKTSTLINIFEEEPLDNICPHLTLENIDNVNTENNSLLCVESEIV